MIKIKTYLKKIKIFFILISIPMINLKFYGMKICEVVVLLILIIDFFKYLYNKKKIYVDIEFKKFIRYMIFIFVSFFIVSIPSFYREFYIPYYLEGVVTYRPILITCFRMLQLFICLYLTYYFYKSIRTKEEFAYLLKTYIVIGLLDCSYGLISCFMYTKFLINLGGASFSDGLFRINGTFNEGGPFGNYIVSVFIALFVYCNVKKVKKINIILSCLILSGTLIMCKSKAALCLIVLIALISFLKLSKNNVKQISKWILIIFLLIIPILMLNKNNFINGINGYYQSYVSANYIAYNHIEDGNFVYGRVAGSHIIPQMIKNHFWLGIGLGNYPIVRNNPIYLQSFPQVFGADYSGLGILEVIAEVGVPLGILFIFILFIPMKLIKRRKLPFFLVPLASFQVLISITGTQITFMYPYIITSMLYIYYFIFVDKKCSYKKYAVNSMNKIGKC